MKSLASVFKFLLFFFYATSVHAMEVSYDFVDIDSLKSVTKMSSQKPMVLASVSKLYTTYYLLNHLEPNKTINTLIYVDSNTQIKDGHLKGDLIIRPEGNPYLTAQNFIDLIYQIKREGINHVDGNFIIDTHGFWKTERLSDLGLEDQADNSAMGAFNFEFNRFNVDKYSADDTAQMDYIRIEEEKINEPGLKFKLKKKTPNEVIWIKNTNEEHKYREALPARDSNQFSGHFFRHLAALHGLILPVPKVENTDIKGRVIAHHESLPLYRLVELGLEYSNNLIAEMLLLQMDSSSVKEASKKMLTWYGKQFNEEKFLWDKTQLVNGSGLGLGNLTTAQNLAQLLASIYKKKQLKRSFISYLSINDHSGGIRRRLRNPKQSFSVYAKTGSLFYVNNLAGYVRAKSGKLYAFSIFTTDENKRSILQRENSKKVNNIRQGQKAWYSESSKKIDEILSSFIMNR